MNNMEKFEITFGFNNDGEYIISKTNPILATDEQEACYKLIDQFESYEGIPCDVISVTKL